MSYMRFPTHIWHDHARVHFWIPDGADEWEESGWGHAMRERLHEANATETRAGGVGVPQDVVDAFVMMRVAELVRDGLVDASIESALAQAGNFGSLALVERADAIRAALVGIGATS
jgi:hypothetical protein